MSKLIIVESPAKARTLRKFLDSQFVVKASMGHVRDLPKSKLGIDVKDAFRPQYIVIKGKGKIISELKSAAKIAEEVLIATDPDREGEAIAWHLAHILNMNDSIGRIELREITKEAFKKALKSVGGIELDKVNAQQARRLLDRLVGYKLSPLLWHKIRGGLSAGRVQSVALKLICDREREIEKFIPREYWTITANLVKQEDNSTLEANLVKKGEEKLEITNQQQAESVVKEIKKSRFIVEAINIKQQKRDPAPPFITSTLQQEAFKRFGFKVSRTMALAQQLYEGLDIGPEGTTGLITYMRTDSTRVSAYAQKEAQRYIVKHFGASYFASREYKPAKGAQDAHEGIRPTSIFRTPDSIKEYLNRDQYRLYKLIWTRFLASQMSSATVEIMTVDIAAGEYRFRASGSRIKFPGYIVIYTETKEQKETDGKKWLPYLEQGEILILKQLCPQQHFTQAPQRYTEATLVKALEEKGIGRPSTYAPIIERIYQRDYVEITGKYFKPTSLGFIVTDMLSKHFSEIINVDFTAEMENKLDQIEEGKLDWKAVLHEFYKHFEPALFQAEAQMEKVEIEPQISDELCDKCGKNMLIKRGRFGKFLACSGYPQCENTKPFLNKIGIDCPMDNCSGDIVIRKSKKGRLFYGCSRFPQCNFISWRKPTKEICPSCGSILVSNGAKDGVEKLMCWRKDCGFTISRKILEGVF